LAGTGGGISRYIDTIGAAINERSAGKYEILLYGAQEKSPYSWGIYRSLSASFLDYYSKALPDALQRDRVDGLLAPSAFLPLKKVCKTVAVVQDMYALKYRSFMSVRDSWSWWALKDKMRARLYLYALKNADVIVAVSKNTAADIVQFAPGLRGRCRVLYSDVPRDFSLDPARIPERYILYVGGFNTHKNLKLLIMAHAELNRFLPSIPLVLAGYPALPAVDIVGLVEGEGVPELTTIHFRPSLEKMIDLYRGCGLFAYLSRYEGFGLPVLEAIRCGAPVLVNDVSSMPEVAPFPECRTDCTNPIVVAEAMAALLTMERNTIVTKLRQHAERFSASAAADVMLDLLTE
jgi:glycosyltransferase involved in cell wall biosynthesis